ATVDSCQTNNAAVLRPSPEDRVRVPMPVYLFKQQHSSRTFTGEMRSSSWQLGDRISAHLIALTTALDLLLEESNTPTKLEFK
ncbi:MAG: hypothetical protein QGG39_08265, partial [Candidatus Poribacteria bacterium]|nr:hypothetical protein [Candidatus Poribacteria bacterium]